MANQRATPDEVQISPSPREPVSDPTLGIEVPRGAAVSTKHRLVTVGDSLTHGFMSAAVHRTDLSWPAITAYELGLSAEQFAFPTYEWPTGPGGLPLDLERLARSFEKRFGAHLDFWEIVTAGPEGHPRANRCGRCGRHEWTHSGGGDAGDRPGLQQRTRLGRHTGACVDTSGVRRPPGRPASGGSRRLQPVASQRVRC